MSYASATYRPRHPLFIPPPTSDEQDDTYDATPQLTFLAATKLVEFRAQRMREAERARSGFSSVVHAWLVLTMVAGFLGTVFAVASLWSDGDLGRLAAAIAFIVAAASGVFWLERAERERKSTR